jgi:hypothetical protein
MTTYTNYGKASSAERNSGRKPKLSEVDHRTLKRNVSENPVTAAAKVTAELSKSDDSFPNPTSTADLQLRNL